MWTGLILAGGPNRGMNGSAKGLLRFGGEALIQRQVREMKTVCSEVIVVTQDPQPLLPLLERDVRVITDYYPSNGPLVGMHAGFALASYELIWTVGCDMPFISAKAATVLRENLHEGFQAAVPVIKGGVYPLHAVYKKSCVEHAVNRIERGNASAAAFLSDLCWVDVWDTVFESHGVDMRFVKNINSREEYREALEASDNVKAG